jgi:hypothetical protein
MYENIDAAIDQAPAIRPQVRTLDAVHGNYANMTPDQKHQAALAKLDAHIDAGRKQSAAAIRRIQEEVPRDFLVRASKLRFERRDGVLRVSAGGKGLELHDHALGQALGFGVPKVRRDYIEQLKAQGDWGRDLAVHTLNEIYGHLSEEAKLVVRSVNGVARGIVSPAYRREDSGPALEALLGVAREVDAVVTNGYAGDVRVSFKLMLGKPIEIFPGEWAVVGADFTTGDFGGVARELSGWILRLLCLNGAQTVDSFRRVHLGRRLELDEGVQFSELTHELTAKATASAIRDAARALLGPEAVEKMVSQARAANARELDADKALASLKDRVSKEERKAIVEKYNSPDVVELPPGNTAWRWSNALSWLARETQDGDRKLELERLAGEAMAVGQAA